MQIIEAKSSVCKPEISHPLNMSNKITIFRYVKWINGGFNFLDYKFSIQNLKYK